MVQGSDISTDGNNYGQNPSVTTNKGEGLESVSRRLAKAYGYENPDQKTVNTILSNLQQEYNIPFDSKGMPIIQNGQEFTLDPAWLEADNAAAHATRGGRIISTEEINRQKIAEWNAAQARTQQYSVRDSLGMSEGPSFLEIAAANSSIGKILGESNFLLQNGYKTGYLSTGNFPNVPQGARLDFLSESSAGAIKLTETYQYSQTQAGMAQQAVSNYHETWATVGTPALLSFGGLAGVAMNGLVAVVGGVQIYDNPKDFNGYMMLGSGILGGVSSTSVKPFANYLGSAFRGVGSVSLRNTEAFMFNQTNAFNPSANTLVLNEVQFGSGIINVEQTLAGHSIRDVNSIYPTAGRTMNCANCAIATDATLAGRPASALPGHQTSAIELAMHYNKSYVNWIERRGPMAIIQTMENWGEGSRAIVWGYRGSDSYGHFSNVVNQNGVVRFLDGQTGGTTKLNDNYQRWFILRTDK